MNITKINLNDDYGCGGYGELTIYSTSSNRPLILVIPGGAYTHLSTRESHPVVEKFLSMGYDCALLMYSVAPTHFPVQLNEVNKSIEHLSKMYKNIFVMGFSAGGHLAGLAGTDVDAKKIKGLILCYPVISFNDEYTHLVSRQSLLGQLDIPDNHDKFSIDKRVNKDTPPTFIWCCATDEAVNHNNSILMANALKANGIKYRFKEYDQGVHGMALADETATKDGHENCYDELIATWPNLVDNFIWEVLDNGK